MCWFVFQLEEREKRVAQMSFLTVSYHSLGSHFPVDRLALARRIMLREEFCVGPAGDESEEIRLDTQAEIFRV